MAITPLPAVPDANDGPDTFTDDVDAFLGALPTWTDQVNATAAAVDADAVSAAASAAAALSSKNAAAASETNAFNSASAAAYKGLWSAQTGAANKPYTVFHNGSFWALNNNLANVTTSTPSLTNADWQFISGTRWQAVQTANFTAAKNALHSVTATSATLDVALPAFAAGDFFVIANNPTSTQLMRIVKTGVTVTNQDGRVVAAGDNITVRAGRTFRARAISSTELVVY